MADGLTFEEVVLQNQITIMLSLVILLTKAGDKHAAEHVMDMIETTKLVLTGYPHG